MRGRARHLGRLRAPGTANVRVRASGYVDASGDAALTWQAGLPCWEPSRPIYGSQQVIVENLHEAHKPEAGRGRRGVRRAGRGVGAAAAGRARVLLPRPRHRGDERDPHRRAARPDCRLAGHVRGPRPGRRARSRCSGRSSPRRSARRGCAPTGSPGGGRRGGSRGAHQLTVDEVRSGIGFDDAVARTAWPVELHDRSRRLRVGDVPGRSRALRAAAVAARRRTRTTWSPPGRCADGDAAALSSVRVMGPCSAMGAAAAHALNLAAGGSPHRSTETILTH